MSKALSTVGKVAGVVAIVAPFFGPVGATVALVAAAVATTANVGAELTAKKPPARGSVNGITIGTDAPMPIPLGRTYYGGTRQYQTGYGPTTDKLENPYAFIVDLYSGVTIAGFQGFYADFASLGIAAGGGAAGGYAGGFLWADAQRGLTPEPRALLPHWSGAPNWGAASKLSGEAAVGWSLLFDRKGKVFASGVPQLGVTLNGALGYDARKDSTYPGGSGPHRIADEATREWSADPGVMGLTYALGWRQNGMKVAGIGIPADGIVVADFVHLSNVCQANGWALGGVVFEPALSAPSTRWQNLKDILAAGGAEPCFKGGRLGVKLSAPQIALDTIRADDLADGEIVIGAMQGWESRLNTIIPKYRSEPHKWEYVQSEPVTIASYVAQDGEVKREERQFNLVQNKDQAAQLAAYELLDRRELGEIELRCKPRMRRYSPGDLLIVDIPEAGLAQQPCIILKRSVDAGSMTVNFTLRGETPGKHAFALGRSGTAPPTPALRSTADLDGVAASIGTKIRPAYRLVKQAVPFPASSDNTSITITAFEAVVEDDGGRIVFPAGKVEGLLSGISYDLLYTRVDRDEPLLTPDGVAVLGPDDRPITSLVPAGSYVAYPTPALDQIESSDFIYVREISTLIDGQAPPSQTPPAGDSGNGSGGGGNGCPTEDAMILLANADRTGPGLEVAAGELQPGMWVWTRHDITGVWAAYLVTAVSKRVSPVVRAEIEQLPGALPSVPVRALRASPGHRIGWAPWTRLDAIGVADGEAVVVKITVAGAQTYVVNGVGSHNLKPTQAEL